MSTTYSKYTKADLLSVLSKLEIKTTSKSTKKILIEKLDAYISEHPEDGLLTVQSLLEQTDDAEDDDDEEDDTTLHEDIIIEETEESDKDYDAPPPLSLKEWIVDPIIEGYEAAVQKVYEFTDSVGITYLEYSDDLREQLSKSVTLNYLEIVFELLFFLYNFVSIVPLKDNFLTHDLLKDNIPYLSTSTIPTPQLIDLLEYKSLSTLFTWIVFSVVAPLSTSYFVNFSRRVLVFDDDEGVVARIYDYDPFIFALSKIVIFLLIGKNASSLLSSKLITGDCLCSTLKNFLVIQLGSYEHFSHLLGAFPLVLGGANLLVALYSQFEEY